MDRLGDYRLRKRLAVGGMGEVYLGEKVGPEGFVKPVVLKCVLPQLAKDRAFVQLFLDEARLAALLNHPNIAQIYDFGVTDAVYFMAMEYVPGYTVDDLRRKHTAIDRWMPIEHVACIATQVCQGLNYAHALNDARGVSLGLVHRDVSPHNLIVSVDGAVKIVDFGIAKARAGLTRVQAKGAVGKFGYMSPEQSRGESVDARTDVFSLGVCLWELVTNRRLHDAKIDRPPGYDPRRPIPPVTSFRRDVPRQFERILETALSIEKEQRYGSCQEMHMDMERFLAAMTHYAGQSALSNYLRDLAEGRIEQAPQPRSREIVEPAGGPKMPNLKDVVPTGLEVAQRYEEVFGTSTERSSAAPTPMRAVPASWHSKPPPVTPAPPLPSIPPNSQPLELALNTPAPSRDSHDRRTTRPPPRSEARPRKASSPGIVLIGAVVVVAALAAGAVVYRESLAAWVQKLAAGGGPTKTAPVMVSAYRISSDPAGAEVYVDGQMKGATPLDLELSPDLEYRLEIKKPGRATKRTLLEAKVSSEIRPLAFRLDPAATLRITSQPTGARVQLNGFDLRGQTPMILDDVPAGQKLQVVVSLDGKRPKTRDVEIGAGKTEKMHFELDER